MSDVVVTVVESNTNVTVTEQDVAVAVTETTVEVSAATAGIQGVPGANNDPVYVTVRNATGALITKGSIVYVSGGNGTHTQVTKAIASGDSTSARTLGWLADDIANNADGLCMVEGYLDGVNTQGVTEGSQLYLSGTVAGAYQVAKPVAPIHLVYVGVCVKASAGNGRVYVKVQNGYELSEIHDVLIVSPTNNQVLAYDSATQLWKNATNAPDGVTSITAVSPLTGGTITSTGSIGLDQTALSITKSQVSDFTSGTVTSASTAQQAGTAVFASFSGIATSATSAATATNAGTAVYATTSGTAVTISGDITKSQVSDFTSGTVASAGTAQQAGTAVFANTSGTATYADTSGTAVFSTNASTAVTISGSITQSQVTDLTTDLAGKANLAGGNAFTGAQTVTGTATGSIVQIIRGASGQANDFFSIQNSGGTALARANLNGSFFFGQTTGSYPTFFGASGSLAGMINVVPASAAVVPILVRGAASQTADLLQLQNSAGSNQFVVGPSGVVSANGAYLSQVFAGAGISGGTLGRLNVAPFNATQVPAVIRGFASQSANALEIQTSDGVSNTSMTVYGGITSRLGGSYPGVWSVGTGTASTIGLVVRGAASQSANLQEWQDSSGNILSRISSSGDLVYGRFSGSGFSTGTGSASIFTNNAAVVALTVKGAASQSANLQEWQNSAGTVLASVLNGGGIRAPFYQVGSSGVVTLATANSGGQIYMAKQTAQATSPGAGNAHLYFRDGTNAGTLKLVVRAGAAGAETTILDNIPQ